MTCAHFKTLMAQCQSDPSGGFCLPGPNPPSPNILIVWKLSTEIQVHQFFHISSFVFHTDDLKHNHLYYFKQKKYIKITLYCTHNI